MKLAKQTKNRHFLLRKQPSPVGEEDGLPYLTERLAPKFSRFVLIKFYSY